MPDSAGDLNTMKKSLVMVVIVAVALVAKAEDKGRISSSARSPVQPFESDADPTSQGRIDDLVFGRLKQLGIAPAKICSDAVFLRRAYLDVIGTLPTAGEARQFLQDTDADKRHKLVDRLLEREEFIDYWTMKWCDLLRVKSEFPINLWPNAVQAYHRWIRTCLKENTPYDRFVREMLTASGSNFRKPQVNFYRALQSREPQAIAQAVALSFMGVRPQSWPKERWAGMAAFFSEIAYKPTTEWKEEIVLWDFERAPTESAANTRALAAFPDQTAVRLSANQDPRQVFANWLIAPKNPWFARHMANRVWFWLLGRGIVHPADDLRPDNPPSNPELLAFLEQELVASRYDLKHLYRLILNSATYQLSHVSATERFPGRGQLCVVSPAASGGGSADRRPVPDHGHEGAVFQHHSGALHVYARRPAGGHPGRRQHHQSVSGKIRPFVARHGSGVGPQQSAHGGAAAAPVEFQPRAPQDRDEPQTPAFAAYQWKDTGRNRKKRARSDPRAVPDDPLALPDGRGAANSGSLCQGGRALVLAAQTSPGPS